MLPKYTTQKSDQYGEVLIINGKESQCPYKPAMALPSQNALGQTVMQIISFPCCTSCPHAWIEKLGEHDVNSYIITCNGNYRDFEIEQIEPENIIKL
jgi:hypothetical protein